MRGVSSATARRSFFLASSARNASKSSGFNLTARRPLAVVERAFDGARPYASSSVGVVSEPIPSWLAIF
jgi:2-oxoglutarate dehydrogenase E1 component